MSGRQVLLGGKNLAKMKRIGCFCAGANEMDTVRRIPQESAGKLVSLCTTFQKGQMSLLLLQSYFQMMMSCTQLQRGEEKHTTQVLTTPVNYMYLPSLPPTQSNLSLLPLPLSPFPFLPPSFPPSLQTYPHHTYHNRNENTRECQKKKQKFKEKLS